jgi:predicted RNase H-like nuclease (RuvC/YqgF family)
VSEPDTIAEQSIRELSAEIETLHARVQTLELTNAEMGVELATARNEVAEFGARAQAFVQQATTLRAAEATVREQAAALAELEEQAKEDEKELETYSTIAGTEGARANTAEATVREQAAALAELKSR